MWPGLPGERGPGHVIWVLWGLDPSTTDRQGCADTGHQQYCGKCGIDPDISSGVGKVIPWSTRLLGRVGGFLLRGVLTIGAELMRPLSSSTLSKDITLLGLGRDRHQPLTRVRTGIDDLAINQILHTLNLRNSERVILGTRLISERHILGSNLHRLRRLTRFTRLQAGQILKPGHGELFTLFSHVVLHHVVRDRSILGSNQNVLQRHITFTKIGKVRTLPTKISGVLNVQQFNPVTVLLDELCHINPSMRRPSHIDFKRHILRISLSNQDLPCRHLLTIELIRSCELLVMVITKELLKPRINSTLTKTIHRLSSSQRVLIGINTRGRETTRTHILLAHRTHKLQRLIETIFINVKVRGRHTQPSRISLLTELLSRKPTEVPTIRLDILQTNLTKTIQHRLLTILINPRDQREHLDRHLISRNRHTIRLLSNQELEGVQVHSSGGTHDD